MQRRWCARCDACWACGGADRPHYGRGLCERCFGAQRRDRSLMLREPPPKRWCIYCDSCLECGTQELKHEADGLCVSCYERSPARAATYARYRHTEGRKRSLDAWRGRNADVLTVESRLRSRLRRGRENGIVDHFPPWLEQLVLAEFGSCCVRCGATSGLCLDHHRPLRHGHRLLDNAVVLCLGCNSAKENQLPQDFYDLAILRRIERALAWCRVRRLATIFDDERAA